MALSTNDSKDGISWTGATNQTISFTLLGGKYMIATEAAGTSVAFSIIDTAGNAILVTNGQFTTSAGTAVLDLPPGSYQVVVTSVTAIAGFVQKIPYNPAY